MLRTSNLCHQLIEGSRAWEIDHIWCGLTVRLVVLIVNRVITFTRMVSVASDGLPFQTASLGFNPFSSSVTDDWGRCAFRNRSEGQWDREMRCIYLCVGAKGVMGYQGGTAASGVRLVGWQDEGWLLLGDASLPPYLAVISTIRVKL